MEYGRFGIELDEETAWLFITRSYGRAPTALDSPIHEILRWVVEQLGFGCWAPSFDADGNAVGLLLGKDVPLDFDAPVMENAKEYALKRLYAVQLAGLFADAREGGVTPKSNAMVDRARCRAIDNPPSPESLQDQIARTHPANAWVNTELHYAADLVRILGQIHAKMFIFGAPPICGVLPASTSRALKQATRAYFFGLNQAAVALCRALLEDALKSTVNGSSLKTYRRANPTEGELVSLIEVASKGGLLSPSAASKAHDIRKSANILLHNNREPTDQETVQILHQIRFVLDELSA